MRRLVLVSVGALVLLIGLYWRVDESARAARAPWTRQQTIDATRALAAGLGVDAGHWQYSVTAVRETQWQRMRRKWSDSAVAQAFDGPRYRVRAWSGREYVTAEFLPDGRPLSWKMYGVRAEPTPERVLSLFARAQTGEFQAVAGKDDKPKEERLNRKWEWKDPQRKDLTASLSAWWEDGSLRDVNLELILPKGARAELETIGRDFSQALVGFGKFFQVCAFSAALVFCLLKLTDRRDHWRVCLVVAAVVAGVYLTCLALGAWTQSFRTEVIAERRTDRSPGLGELLVEMFFNRALMLGVPLATGFLLLRGRQIQAWLGLLPLLMRRRATPRLGHEILSGLLASTVLAAIPYVAVAILPFWDAQVVWTEPRVMVEQSPALGYLFRLPKQTISILCLGAIVLPSLLRPLQPRRWRFVLLALVAWSMVADNTQAVQGNGYLNAGVCAALTAALWVVYQRYGLAGTLASAFGMGLVPQLASLLLHFPGREPQVLQMAALLALPLCGAVWLSRREETNLEDELAVEIARRNDPSEADRPRSERERLLTEFAVARQAQAGMLPAAPPEIPGFTLAAACIPAREVGGDLFDFLEFPEGRWGICVADVSGKGVPAALYMTLTKGMLAAEQSMASDSVSLIRAVNQQLHQAGKRRTFVTMAWGLFDPATRTVEMLRAGHNPVLWYRAATRDSVYLQPKGMGLGLTSDRIFSRSLETHRVELAEGDALVFYSDGLTEAMNPELELFGEDRLQQAVATAPHDSAGVLLQSILNEVELFKNGEDPHDDLTLVVLRAG